ncbi:MAG TPA: hypothetical protein VKU79_06485 [Thermoplasmataceae archaeon]|nr:hypothetical protein [Thermoplasmataceae archaeon]
MANKDTVDRCIEELVLVSAELLREVKALRRNTERAQSLMRFGKTCRAIQHISRAMDLRFGDMAQYAEDIIAQIVG